MNILHLTIHRRWFDAICSGTKHEEYRTCGDYWRARLMVGQQFRKFDTIVFRNGRRSDSPTVVVQHLGTSIGIGRQRWGAPRRKVFRLQLGEIVSRAE